jgi:hypothetical protein
VRLSRRRCSQAPRLVVYVLLVLPSVAFTVTARRNGAAPGLARLPEEPRRRTSSRADRGREHARRPLLVGVVLTVSTPGGSLWSVRRSARWLRCSSSLHAMQWRLRVSGREDSAPESLSRWLGRVRSSRAERAHAVLLLGAQAVALGALDILYVELARGVLHLGGNWAGYLNAAFGSARARNRSDGASRRPPAARAARAVAGRLDGRAVRPVATPALLSRCCSSQRPRSTVDSTPPPERCFSASPGRPRPSLALEGLEMAGLAVGSLLAAALVAFGGAAAAFAGVGCSCRSSHSPRAGGSSTSTTAPVVEVALLRSVPMLSSAAADARVARPRSDTGDRRPALRWSPRATRGTASM